MLFRLAISNFLAHKARVILTAIAIALSVSLVVAVTSGYASIEASARKFFAQFLGSWDAQITRPTDRQPGLAADLVSQIQSDASVRRAVGRLEADVFLLKKDGTPAEGRHATVYGLDRANDDTADRLKLKEGRWFNADETDAVVIDEGTRTLTQCTIGDTIQLPSADARLTMRVVGIVHKPGILTGYVNTIYAPLVPLQKFSFDGKTDRISKIQIEFNENVDADAFMARWTDKLKNIDPLLRLKLTRERREDLDTNLRAVHVMSYLGSTVSMLAATFIVFSTVSMGVSERQRSLAMLRAVGLLRSQLVWLVLIEGLCLGALGAIIGVPLGVLWVRGLVWKYDALFSAGAVIAWGGVSFAVLGSIGAALVASILPAISASRVDPLEAMSPLAKLGQGAHRPPMLATIVGVLLVAVDPAISFIGSTHPGELERSARFYSHFVIGLPALMLGFFLLGPLFVWLIDALLAAPIARLLGMQSALLRQQLSGGLWRAAGTCAALMVGLAVLIVLQTQGHTALAGWKLPDKFPDLFIYTTSRAGLDQKAQQMIANAKGVKSAETMPIAMFSPELGGSMFGLAGAAMMPGATMFFGVDPDKAFDLMHLDFRQGNPKDAAAMLKKGKHLVVTEEFHKLKGLNVGDTLTLVSLTRGKMDFIIAGVVWSPGIDVMVSTFDLGRQFEDRTAASVFGSLQDSRELFGVEHVYLVAANLELGLPKEQLVKDLQHELGDKGLNVADVRQLKHDIVSTFQRLLMVASIVAWAAMGVASLGVTNTVMASVRSRRWQFGILRSIGVTRSMLLRIVLGEALLLGIVSVALGSLAGMIMSADAHVIWGLVFGYVPDIAVPWGIIFVGASVVMIFSILASLFPAIAVSQEEPLTLLQAGRAAA